MARNIIIIAAAAIVAFLAVLLIPQLIDGDGDGGTEESEVASADPSPNQASQPGSSSGGKTNDGQAAPPQQPAANPQLAAVLDEAVRQINAQAPMQIDYLTVVTRAEHQGNRLRYHYRLTRQLSQAELANMQQVAPRQIRQRVCSQPDSRQLFTLGGIYEFVYYGPNDEYLFSLPVDGC